MDKTCATKSWHFSGALRQTAVKMSTGATDNANADIGERQNAMLNDWSSINTVWKHFQQSNAMPNIPMFLFVLALQILYVCVAFYELIILQVPYHARTQRRTQQLHKLIHNVQVGNVFVSVN